METQLIGGIEMVNLAKRIEIKRSEMIELGVSKGLAHPETVQASQELDILINEKQKEGGSDKVAIAENLKHHRKGRNWSQVELSDKSGVSQAQISGIESGTKANPGVITIKKLADALHVSVEELIK